MNFTGLQMEIILSIVGGFGTVALTINAFFLRGIFVDMNAVKIKLAEMSARSEGKQKSIDVLEANQKEIFERLNIIEREVLK